MKYSTYNDNRYNATVHKDNNKLDVKVGNPENKKHIPGAVIEYGVKSVNGKYGDVVLNYEDVGALPDTEIIPRYIVDDVEYVITKYTKDIVSGVEGVSLWFDDGTPDGDSIFMPSDKGVQTIIINHLVNYYTKSEVYNKQEVDDIVSKVVSFKIEVVEELPTHDISTSTIYLVPLSEPKQDNHYKEYIYVNNNWELIGTTEVDLTNYYTKSEVNDLLDTKQDVLDSYVSSINGQTGDVTITIPTKTSELINDSNFATITFVDWIGE